MLEVSVGERVGVTVEFDGTYGNLPLWRRGRGRVRENEYGTSKEGSRHVATRC